MTIHLGSIIHAIIVIVIFGWFSGYCAMFWFMNDSGATKSNKLGFYATELVIAFIWFGWCFDIVHFNW